MFRFYSKSNETKARVSVVGECTEGTLRIAVARCSKKDNFIKKKGRTIAEGRLTEGKLYTQIPMETCDVRTFVYLAKSIAGEVANNTTKLK